MNQSQLDALAKIDHLLREHFESFALVLQYEADDHRDVMKVYWKGGFTNTIGLLEEGKIFARNIQSEKYDSEP